MHGDMHAIDDSSTYTKHHLSPLVGPRTFGPWLTLRVLTLAQHRYIPLNSREMLVFIEAENMTTTTSSGPTGSTAPGWMARPWAHSNNYFASTVANVFHSRR
jgi:hypothetical protein